MLERGYEVEDSQDERVVHIGHARSQRIDPPVSDTKSRVATRAEIHTLHRYWIWADQMRLLFTSELARVGSQFDADGTIHRDAYMSLWYGLLAVVIEGWTALRLSDGVVHELLLSPYVDKLRLYRNGVFHYQRRYWDERRTELLMGGSESAAWVQHVHNELGRVLLAAIRS
jgi:hypothetical protein